MTRKRNSKGQFIKETNVENYKMELTIPNIKYLIKYTILLCILLPWIYLFLVKFLLEIRLFWNIAINMWMSNLIGMSYCNFIYKTNIIFNWFWNCYIHPFFLFYFISSDIVFCYVARFICLITKICFLFLH